MSNDNTLDKLKKELEVFASDASEREKLLSKSRDMFLNKRVFQATKLEELRSKIIDGIEKDIDTGKVNPQQKLRYLEIVSKINEADLNVLSGFSKGVGGINIINTNSSATNIKEEVEEQQKTLKIVSSNGVIKNEVDAQHLLDAVDSINVNSLITSKSKKIEPTE